MIEPVKIQTLHWQVANQIAAGEVIERPASVVKELLENALDAAAKQIVVEIGYGGLNQITVNDDGCGIDRDDLPLAIAPHATSKLRVLQDLEQLTTLGFRGEALASIASVSHLNIQSRPHGAHEAFGVRQVQNEVMVYSCARSPGTTVDIRDLFFNAPVRKKFLKSAELEYLAIEAVVKRFAFCNPQLALTLTHNGKTRLRLPAALTAEHQQQRVQKLFGKAFCAHAFSIEAEQETLRLSGWVSAPLQTRSQQDKQWIYLNGRMLRDKLLLHAIKLAYEGLLPVGRFPLCLLTLSMPPAAVDVNVHPTKHEVRFSDPRAVHDFVRGALRAALVADKTPREILPVHTVLTSSPEVLPNWQVVTGRFALLQEHEQMHLIDVARLRHEARLAQLLSTPLPWVARSLLLPIYLSVTSDLLQVSAAYQQQLTDYGLQWQIEGGRVLVQAIPRDLPGLDLRGLLLNLAQQQPVSSTAIIAQLLAAEAWDLRQASLTEQSHWHAEWCRLRRYSRCLDDVTCEELCSV